MRNQLETILLLGTLSALIVGLGALIAPSYLYLFGALALAMNLGAYFFSDRIVLRLHRAREVTRAELPDLHRLIEELAAQAQIPSPRVFIIPEEQPNAFATGRNPERGVVAVTEGILHLLDARELRGVLAHELAHIKNRDILVSSIAAAAASVITYAAQALSFSCFFGAGSQDADDDSGSTTGTILVALVAPLAATLIQLGISRSREYLADETGARIGGDPEALARALVKLDQAAQLLPGQGAPATASLFIVNPFSAGDTLSRWLSTHPKTQERVDRLLQMARSERPGAVRGFVPSF